MPSVPRRFTAATIGRAIGTRSARSGSGMSAKRVRVAASSPASAAAARVSDGVIGRDELDGEDVFARSPVAPMAAVPGTRAVPAVVRRAHVILDPTGRSYPAGDG